MYCTDRWLGIARRQRGDIFCFFIGWESSTRNPILRLEFLMVHWSETKFVECDAGKMHLEGCMVPSIRPWMKSRFFGAPVIFFFCPFKKGASQFGDGGAV